MADAENLKIPFKAKLIVKISARSLHLLPQLQMTFASYHQLESQRVTLGVELAYKDGLMTPSKF